MKKRSWLPVAAVVTALALTACLKKGDDVPRCTPNSLTADRQSIDSFLNGSSMVTYNPNLGVYTGVLNPGTGNKPTDDSLIRFKYTIKTLSGTTVVSSDTIPSSQVATSLRLSDLKNGEPVLYNFASSVNQGGSFRVIVPSSYYAGSQIVSGAGCQQLTTTSGVVLPAYSQLIYDFVLTNVKKP